MRRQLTTTRGSRVEGQPSDDQGDPDDGPRGRATHETTAEDADPLKREDRADQGGDNSDDGHDAGAHTSADHDSRAEERAPPARARPGGMSWRADGLRAQASPDRIRPVAPREPMRLDGPRHSSDR